jgi:hypothetical protein
MMRSVDLAMIVLPAVASRNCTLCSLVTCLMFCTNCELRWLRCHRALRALLDYLHRYVVGTFSVWSRGRETGFEEIGSERQSVAPHVSQADFWTGTSSGLHRDLTETGAYDAHGRRNSQVRISGQWTTPHWEAKAEMPRRYIAPWC